MITGNKGEWSEVYVLLRVLAEKNLYAGDENLNRIETLLYPVINIIRQEASTRLSFSYEGDLVFISQSDVPIARIPISEFAQHANRLLTQIQKSKGSSFYSLETEEFLKSFQCVSLKAKSTSKSDIHIKIHDSHTQSEHLLGFSIKSQLGSASTLLNAGQTTNFIFEILGTQFSESQINAINQIDTTSKIKDRISKIIELGGELHFHQMNNRTFENNLILIDSKLPNLLSEMLMIFFKGEGRTIKEIVKKLNEYNPLGYNLHEQHPFYEYKVKRLLTDIALGMTPATVWSGTNDATGGYLVVKADGDVLCYHIYNRNQFEDYLFSNTKFDTPSSTRYDFGGIFKHNEKQLFKLCLQIRFS